MTILDLLLIKISYLLMALLSFSKSYFVAPFAYFLQEQVFFGIEIKYKFLQWLIIVLNVEVAICALNIIANNLTVFFLFS